MEAASSKTVGWFAGRIPDGWFTGPPVVTYDRDEVLVLGTIPAPDLGADVDEDARAAAVQSRIEAFREVIRGRGLGAIVRYSGGGDVGAACGQLARDPIARPARATARA